MLIMWEAVQQSEGKMKTKLRDASVDRLAVSVPKEYSDAREIGGIVSMWSLLENVASAILETGYLTKGSEGQNLTTFYFKTR